MSDLVRVPSLFVQNKGEDATKVSLMLTKAAAKTVVRLTGGCGYMSAEDADGLNELFRRAFAGFEGALIFGGTRMLRRQGPEVIVPGITEVAPLIGADNPGAVIFGIVPRSENLGLRDVGMVVADSADNDYYTIIHPDQDVVLVVQQSVDQGVSWEAEYEVAMQVTANLRSFANWSSLLVVYNGGSVTEKEVRATAAQGWPVLLIKGSGRKADELAQDVVFLRANPTVSVCANDPVGLRQALVSLGVVPERKQGEVISLHRKASS